MPADTVARERISSAHQEMERGDDDIRHIRRATKISSALGYLPYKWCDRAGRVIFDNRPQKRFWVFFQMSLYWSYLAYLAGRCLYVTYYNTGAMTSSSRTELQYVFVGHCSVLPIHVCSLYFYGHHHVVIRKYLMFRRELETEWKNTGKMSGQTKWKSSSKFCRRLVILAIFNTLSNWSPIFRNPKAVNQVTAVIPGVETIARWKLLPFAILEFFIFANPWFSYYFYFAFVMGLVAGVSNKLGLLR